MSKVYIAEYPGLAFTSQGDSVPCVGGSPLAEQVIDTTATTGAIKVLGAITGGTLYTAGTYLNVPLTGGTGSGATANITVAAGAVTQVTLVSRGTAYTAADTLSAAAANIGGTGSGFTIPVTSISVRSAPLNAKTAYVEISADGICSVALGTDAVAATTNARLAANERLPLRGVPVGQGFVVSAITNT